MSLKYRIAALVFLLEIVMVGVVLWQMQARALDDGRLRLAKSERVIVSLLHELALAALITGNYATFQEFIDSVTRDSHARAVLVTDARRYVVASSDATLLGRAMPPLDDDARDYWRRAAVTGASGDLGEVAVRFSAEELLAAADAQTMFGLRLALAGMFVIACAGIIAGHVLTRRLERLRVASRAVALGNFEVRFDTRGRDEVAHLAQSFHGMVERIGDKVAALQASQRRVQLLLDATAEGICGLDDAGRCMFINAAGVRLLGYDDAAELLGQDLRRLVHPGAPDGTGVAAALGFDQAAPARAHRSILWRRDGRACEVEHAVFPVHEADQPVGTLLTFRDVSEQSRAEREAAAAQSQLVRSEARFRTMAELGADWFWELDAAERFTWVAGRCEEILGLREEQLLGRTRREIYQEFGTAADLAQLRASLNGEGHAFRDVAIRWVRPDGGQRDIALSGGAVLDEQGRVLGYRGVGRDVTQMQRASRALRESEQRFRDFADLAADWFWEMDADLRFTYLSGNYEKILGVQLESVLGKTRAEFHAMHTELDSEAWQAHQRTLDAREAFRDFEFDWNDAAASRVISLSGRPLFDPRGTFIGYRGVGREVTALRSATRRLQRLLQENRRLTRGLIEAQEEERRRVARELHDDMGQALTAIQAEAQSLRLGWDAADASGQSSIAAIQDNTAHVYACMHAVMERLHPALVDDLGLVEALRDLCISWSARHDSIELRAQLPDHIDCLPGQRIALFRIAQECLTNVAKHARARTVTVQLTQIRAGLEFEIGDDGAGVDLARRRRGLGLLGICERAEGLGGRVDFTSAPGQGFSVRVYVPTGAASDG